MGMRKWCARISHIGKKVRKAMKNAAKKGHSARNGNAPSPYTKYKKKPYQYMFKSAKVKAYETTKKAA